MDAFRGFYESGSRQDSSKAGHAERGWHCASTPEQLPVLTLPASVRTSSSGVFSP